MSLDIDSLDLLPAEETMGFGLQLRSSCCGDCFSSMMAISRCND